MNNGTEQIFLLNAAPSQSSATTQRMGALAPPPSYQVNLDNVENFSNVCRICATITEFVMPIFSGEGLQNNLSDKIKKHLPIQVREGDELPLVVCYQCASTLLAWHELVKCCVQADAALRAKLSSNQRKTNPPNNITIKSNPSIQDDPPSKSPCHSPEEPRSAHSDHSELSDDKPNKNLYSNFYNALVNFRDHFVNDQHHEDYPDYTDSSVSDGEDNDVDRFDDLTQSNMRRDRLDEETRLELREVQNKIDNKTYYTCKICGKNLSSAHTYLFHKRIHTGERPCVCHVCGKQFRAPNGLQRHLTETHERVRRYNCSICTKNFANSQNLKQHIRIHTGEKPFVCSHCGKRFTQSGSLHVHLKTHSEQFPYDCAECGAKFRLRSGLVRHRLKHTGERPYACAICGAGFRQRHELRAHAAAHSGVAPHACASCPRAFRQRRTLRHHIKRVHEAEPPDLGHATYTHVAPY